MSCDQFQLSMAVMLGRFNVPTLMVERRSGAAAHPRARSINLRTGEIFRLWGIENALKAVSLPEAWTQSMVYTETLAGQEIGHVPTSTQGIVDGAHLSPAPWLLSSQDQFEPVIRDDAETLKSVDLRWQTELKEFQVDEQGVTASLRSYPTGEVCEVRADWLIAADGAASPIRHQLGIEMVGQHQIASLINVHFRANIPCRPMFQLHAQVIEPLMCVFCIGAVRYRLWTGSTTQWSC